MCFIIFLHSNIITKHWRYYFASLYLVYFIYFALLAGYFELFFDSKSLQLVELKT